MTSAIRCGENGLLSNNMPTKPKNHTNLTLLYDYYNNSMTKDGQQLNNSTAHEVNDYRDDSFDSRYESADEGGSKDEPHMYPDDGDYDPSSDF